MRLNAFSRLSTYHVTVTAAEATTNVNAQLVYRLGSVPMLLLLTDLVQMSQHTELATITLNTN